MDKYILSSEIFKGDVIITVEGDRLQADFTSSSVSVDQQRYILKRMSEGIKAMLEHFNTPPTDCKMVKMVVDFEMFWNKYDDKIASSKKRAKAKWDKMSESERTGAYNYIQKYYNSIPYGTRKKYAETYLNAELWNN